MVKVLACFEYVGIRGSGGFEKTKYLFSVLQALLGVDQGDLSTVILVAV